MNKTKTTRSEVREYNRRLILTHIYRNKATNRAELARTTGLSKPTVSNVVDALIRDNYLLEVGIGESTWNGGKRPLILKFMADAREVIGVSLDQGKITAVLTNLDGDLIATHRHDLPANTSLYFRYQAIIEAINGLTAQTRAPLLCIGLSLPGMVSANGTILFAADFESEIGTNQVTLFQQLRDYYEVPIYFANTSEVTALARMMFDPLVMAERLVALVIGENSVGIGAALQGGEQTLGSEIGFFMGDGGVPFEKLLGWSHVRARAHLLGKQHASAALLREDLSYIHLFWARRDGDHAAHVLYEELAGHVARMAAWAVALLRPQHISITGTISDLGYDFRDDVIGKVRALIPAELVDETQFSLSGTRDLAALGAAARAIQMEVGLL